MRLAHPPVTFRHEKLKGEERIPAARRYIVEHGLNELHRRHARRPRHHRAGRPVQRADAHPAAARPGRCLRRERDPAAGAQRHLSARARARSPTSAPASAPCWWSRKASPNTSSRRSPPLLRRRDMPDARCTARTCCRRRASTPSRCWSPGLASFVERYLPGARRQSRRAPGWPAIATRRAPSRRSSASRCRRGRRASASAAPSGRCSRRSSWRSRTSARSTSRPTSAATPSRTFEPFSIGPLDPRLRHEPGQPRRRRRR